VVVESSAIIDGGDLRSASAVANRNQNDYEIAFSLNKNGAEKFGNWTAAHINEYLAVVLNDEVRSIAYIRSQIADQGEITGSFTKQSAEDLALVLKSGSLPYPVKVVDDRVPKQN
jgi:preprotein translocase subunit SecD